MHVRTVQRFEILRIDLIKYRLDNKESIPTTVKCICYRGKHDPPPEAGRKAYAQITGYSTDTNPLSKQCHLIDFIL